MSEAISTKKKAIVVHSPHAGRSGALNDALNFLHEQGIQLEDVRSIQDLERPARQRALWEEGDISLVIAAGGDGMVGGLLPYLVHTTLRMGIMPLGTANDIARSLGISMKLNEAAETIANGQEHKIDLGFTQNPDQLQAEKMLFAHALTIGINAQFASLATDARIRKQYGVLTYPVAVMEAVKTYVPFEAELRIQGLRERSGEQTSINRKEVLLRGQFAQVTVANAPIFWGNLQATVPGASIDDRELDIVIVEDERMEKIMLRVAQFFRQQEPRYPQAASWHAAYRDLLAAELTDVEGIHHFQAQSIIVHALQGEQELVLDGEVRGKTPVKAALAREQLHLLVPRTDDHDTD